MSAELCQNCSDQKVTVRRPWVCGHSEHQRFSPGPGQAGLQARPRAASLTPSPLVL